MNDYVVVKKEGLGFALEGSRIDPTIWFEVQHTDGMKAWESSHFWADTPKRSINGLKLQASNMAKRYQAHLDRTGERFEVEEKKKWDAERLEKRKAARIAWLEQIIPSLQRELEAAYASAAYDLKNGKFVVAE